MSMVENFEKLLASGKDSALLRFSLGNEYMRADDFQEAIRHLRVAVTLNPQYSAAWKLLGKALGLAGETDDARAAYLAGIAVAEQQGDKQAAKEMTVFLKRLAKPAATLNLI